MLDASVKLPPVLTAEHVAGGPDARDVQSMLVSSKDNAEGHGTSPVKFCGKLFGRHCSVLCLDNPPSAYIAKYLHALFDRTDIMQGYVPVSQ
jgi:hypothetical protein